MNHIDENILEKYIFSPQIPSPREKARIEAHLEVCALCREQYDSLKAFYNVFNGSFNSEPDDLDREFFIKLNVKRRLILPSRMKELREESDGLVGSFAVIIESYERSVRQKIVSYFRIHPVGSVAASLGLAAILMFFIVKPFKDSNPACAKIRNYVLTVYNKNAEALWTKPVVGISDCTSEDTPALNVGQRRNLLVGDIDNDGKDELLFSTDIGNGSDVSDSLKCFDSYGVLRWSIGTGEFVSFGDSSVLQHTTRVINDFLILRRQPSVKPQLFVLCQDQVFSPGKLFEVDPQSGMILQDYFYRAGRIMMLAQDVDLDGIVDIIVGGINDGFNRAFITVLDPANIEGYAPVPERYLPKGVPKAIEKYYLLFPLTFLHDAYSSLPYNYPMFLRKADNGKISFQIVESLDRFPGGKLELALVYLLAPPFKVESVAGGDAIIKAQDYLLSSRKLKKPFIPEYYRELKDSVEYWDGDKFVKESVMNKYYKDKLALR